MSTTAKIIAPWVVSTFGAAFSFTLLTTPSYAQEWPSKPIRLIAPQAPGGGPERVIRGLQQGLSQRLGQPVVVDYKPGAAGNIGAAELAKAPADGYTILLGPENLLTINPHIYKSVGYNRTDVVPINLVGSLNQVLACNPKVGVNTFAEFVAATKSKTLTYSSSGAGSIGQLSMEMLLDQLGTKMTHVAYRGPAPAVTDLLGGQVDCTFIVSAALTDYVKTKRVVGLATSSNARIPGIPDMPTTKELGLQNFDANFWLTLFAHKDMPKAIIEKLNAAVNEVARGAEVREAMALNNTILVTSTAEVAQSEFAKSFQKWGAVSKRLNVTVD